MFVCLLSRFGFSCNLWGECLVVFYGFVYTNVKSNYIEFSVGCLFSSGSFMGVNH